MRTRHFTAIVTERHVEDIFKQKDNDGISWNQGGVRLITTPSRLYTYYHSCPYKRFRQGGVWDTPPCLFSCFYL